MLAFRLGFRNLMGAGLRTWLNVSVLSFAFVVIVFYNGMLDGWNFQAQRDTKAWETGGGQFWHPEYDPYDAFTLQDAHAVIPAEASSRIQQNKLAPVLITQATAYPEGRMINILLKGIEADQGVLALPTQALKDSADEISAMIGKRMASTIRAKAGDRLLVRWRDKNGTFDAREVVIRKVFDCNVPTIDNGQIWISLNDLQQMTGMPGEATLMVASNEGNTAQVKGWVFKDNDYLMSDLRQVMQSKKGSSRIVYSLLLAIALLAIFDTQVLSIFRRQREIGTYIALGLTRSQVVGIFTVEGATHSILALLLGAAYGIPLLLMIQHTGIPMPKSAGEMGLSITDSIIPYYSLGMIISTILLVVISATIVSWFPARRIARMRPTDALKGKIQ